MLIDHPTANFSRSELLAMHRWCMQYRHLVRAGGRPTEQQNKRFLAFQAVCYATGASYGSA